jgi:hypothetical protein
MMGKAFMVGETGQAARVSDGSELLVFESDERIRVSLEKIDAAKGLTRLHHLTY